MKTLRLALRRPIAAGIFLSAALAAGLALAQVTLPQVTLPQVTLPQVTLLHQTDLVPLVPRGAPGASRPFVPVGQIAGVPAYVNGGAASTAFSVTFAHGETDYFIQPSGTLATGTLTTEANPSDGQRECFLSTQTQTALTWSANTGQSISNAPTAGVAMTPICITYQASAATWYRSP